MTNPRPTLSRALALTALIGLVGCSGDAAETPPAPDAAPAAPAPVVEATSLLGTPLARPDLPAARRQQLEANLAEAQAAFDAAPDDEMATIWLGRRLAYLSRYRDAVGVFTRGLQQHPDSYKLLRHRGHRYISLRRFDDAIADLSRAAELMPAEPLETEPDGAPNSANIPLSSTQFNVWYHLALAHYLNGEFESALRVYERCMETSVNPDLLVATTDWMVMTMRRMGMTDATAVLLEPITADLEIIENASYHRRLLMYKGELAAEDLLDLRAVQDPDQAINIATQGYGVGNWYLTEGDIDGARSVFERIVEGTSWAAFGYIAAEADLARMR